MGTKGHTFDFIPAAIRNKMQDRGHKMKIYTKEEWEDKLMQEAAQTSGHTNNQR